MVDGREVDGHYYLIPCSLDEVSCVYQALVIWRLRRKTGNARADHKTERNATAQTVSRTS